MPLIRKKRIWWDPVPGVASYVVYAGPEERVFEAGKFMWESTPGVHFKVVTDKNELIIPDDWPEFPEDQGNYFVGVASRDEVGNESDPFVCSGLFKFSPPPRPVKGGIESL
jgi:hypothetical protein